MFPLTFDAPERWWWLLGLLPVLLWLSLPPQPRIVVWTAHLPQWLAAQRRLRRRSPRLRGLQFVLLALAATAAVGAWASPVLPGRPGPTRLVVLLDGSASMAAAEADGRTAFERARAVVLERLRSVPESVDVGVVRCGGPAVRRSGAAARTLLDLGDPAGPAVADLSALAADLARPDTAVWTVTDGQGQEKLPDLGATTLVGRAAPNGAVLAVRVVDRWPLPQLDLAVDVIVFAPAPTASTLTVRGACAPVPPAPLRLEPGRPTTVELALQRSAAGGRVEVHLATAGDPLPADDVWQAELPPLPAPRIAVLAEADAGPYAKVAAEALAGEVGGSVVPSTPGGEVGLLLVDGGAAAIRPGSVRALCFGVRHEGAAEPKPWTAPTVANWDRRSPLCSGLDLSELRIAVASRETLPEGTPFLWAGEPGGAEVPLAVVVGTGEVASVHFAFRLQDSNLPLLPAFPQLLRRSFVRCHGSRAELQSVSPPPPPGEQDLGRRATAPDRPLPEFAVPPAGLAPWWLAAGLLALALRALLR